MQTACNTSMFVECLGQLGVVGWAHRQQPDSLGSSPTSAQWQLRLPHARQYSPMEKERVTTLHFFEAYGQDERNK